MNTLYLVVTSDLKNSQFFLRFAESVDISRNIKVFFVNQSETPLKEIYMFQTCLYEEIVVGKRIPLSEARNIVLHKLYQDTREKTNESINRVMIMFIDDDAWFPKETLEYLLDSDVFARCLRTKDPYTSKSFNGQNHMEGEVKGWHLVTDICSICLVAPFADVLSAHLFFNEKLGVGNKISQGEESLFIYYLHCNGTRIFYDENYIYHPYKNTYGTETYYSLSYFWACASKYVSSLFLLPCVKNMIKYTIGLILGLKDKKYFYRFKAVWKGFYDGVNDNMKVMEKKNDSQNNSLLLA